MATEYEVDRLVVRLVGNQEDYQKMLKDVEKQTDQTAKWSEERGSRIAAAFNKAFRGMQGAINTVGVSMQKAGAASTALGGAVSAPLGKAAMDFSEYGKSIKDIVFESERAAKAAAEMKKSVMANTKAYEELNRVVKLTEEQAATFKLMSERTGVSLEDLAKTVKVGSKEYETWRKEAEKFGLVLSKDDVKAATDLAESWQRVKQAMAGMWTQVGAAISKRFKEWNDLIVGIVTSITKWIRENKQLISTVAEMAEKFIYIGGVLVTVGTALSVIATLLGPIITLIAAGATAWLAWDTATGKFLRGGAADIWNQYSNSVKDALNTTINYGKQIISFAESIMEGMSNAFKAGNLKLAAQIAWEGIKVAWAASLKEIDKLTGEKLSAIFQNLAAGNWEASAEAALNQILTLWTKMLQGIDPIFTQVINSVASFWTTVVNLFEQGVQKVFSVMQSMAQYMAQAAAFAGRDELKEKLLEFGGKAPITSPEGRRKRVEDTDKANKEREEALNQRMLEYAGKLYGLEERRKELISEGKADAADRLAQEQESLKNSLAQAQAERDKVEAERAKGEQTRENAATLRQAQQEALKKDQERQRITEQYDPVTKYMRQLKELNALFDESERTTDVYKKALKDIKEELVNSSFKVNVEFGLTGMDAVRKGTVEEQQLIENTLMALGKEKAEKQALLEVEKRQKELDRQVPPGPEGAPQIAGGANGGGPLPKEPKEAAIAAVAPQDDMLSKLERIAVSTEKLAERSPVTFEALGLI